jgi:hypothetical protein
MLVDMGAAMFFLYEVAYVLAEIINILKILIKGSPKEENGSSTLLFFQKMSIISFVS